MADDRLCSGDHFQELLADLEFHHYSMVHTSCVYYRKKDDTCLIVDTDICSQYHYPYVAYTVSQNELVESHDRVFRFLADPDGTNPSCLNRTPWQPMVSRSFVGR